MGAYTIGLPPKNNSMLGETSWLDIKKNYLKIKLTPLSMGEGGLKELMKAGTGDISLKPDGKKFISRAKELGAGNVKGDTIDMHVLSEAPFTDTYNNTLQNVSMFGQVASSFANSSMAKAGFAMQSSGINATDTIESIAGLAGITLKGDDKGNANWIKAMKEIDKDWQDTSKVEDILKSSGVFGKDSKISAPAAAMLSTAVSILHGNKPLFPEVWWDSSYSCGYNYSVRLYNPNPANTQLHMQTIIDPMCALLALTLPILEKGSNNTYSSPLYVSAECKGLFLLDYGMITNMSIVKGGDDNAIAFNGRPSVVDIRFTITPIYSRRLIGTRKGSGQSNDIKMMIGEDKYEKKENKKMAKEGVAMTNNNTVKTTEPPERVDPKLYDLEF